MYGYSAPPGKTVSKHLTHLVELHEDDGAEDEDDGDDEKENGAQVDPFLVPDDDNILKNDVLY